MEIGLLKSKVETKLIDSYKNQTFQEEIKIFKSLVLEDSSISKAFYIYDELSKKRGFNPNFAEEYLNECCEIYSRVRINDKNLKKVENWVKNIQCENYYKDIDTFLNKNTLVIENIISSRDRIIKNLSTSKNTQTLINLSLEQMTKAANNSIENYLGKIDVEQISEIKKYTSLPQEEIQKRFEVISEMVLEKLEKLSEQSDRDTKERINETITKIKSEEVNYATLYKLKNLNETL